MSTPEKTSGKQEAVTESVEARDSGLPGGVEAATHVRQNERQHLIVSAGYWFKGSRKAQDEGKHAEAVMAMENAYNHIENALAACNDFIDAYFVRGVTRFPDGRTYREHAKELLSRTGGNSLGVSVSSPTPPSVPVAGARFGTGNWRHANGLLICGTLRIAKADFDTDPSDEFKAEIFDQICEAMNAPVAGAPE